MLNRSAIIIRPGKGYITWAAGLDEHSDMVPSVDAEQTTYLIKAYDDVIDAMTLLSQEYPVIFQMELAAWHPDETRWPKDRTFSMFKEWFVIEFHSMVVDLCAHPIERDPRI